MFGAEKSSISSLRRIPVLKTSLKCKDNFAMIWSSNFEPWWHDERSKVEVYCARHWNRIPVRCDDAHMGCAMVLHNPFLRKLFPLFLQTILKQLYLGCVKDCPIMFCIVDCRIILDLLESVKKLIFAWTFKATYPWPTLRWWGCSLGGWWCLWWPLHQSHHPALFEVRKPTLM